MIEAKERIYFYRGWKIEYTGRFWVDLDDKSYVFTSIDEAYDFIDKIEDKYLDA